MTTGACATVGYQVTGRMVNKRGADPEICGMGDGPGICMAADTLGIIGLADRMADQSTGTIMTEGTTSGMNLIGIYPRCVAVYSITSIAIGLINIMTAAASCRYGETMRMAMGSEGLGIMTDRTVAAKGRNGR